MLSITEFVKVSRHSSRWKYLRHFQISISSQERFFLQACFKNLSRINQKPNWICLVSRKILFVLETFQIEFSILQGYTSRWLETFPGAGQNSLLDLQRMLSSQISVVQSLLTKTSDVHSQAQTRANELQSSAQALSR